MDQTNTPPKPSSLFEVLPSKSAFWLGFVTAVLSLGTLGFILLGSCVLKGSCDVSGLSFGTNGAETDDGFAVDDSENSADTNAQAAAAVPVVSDDDNTRGAKNAPVTIIEYSDFECPYCGAFHPTMQQVMKNYEGKVRWVYRHFPLSFHPQALPAANAAECAAEQGRFWEYGDQLFANQDKLGDAYFKQLAGEVGLNINKWQDCVSKQKYNDKIQAQAQSGGAAGVNGTPGSFVVGKDGKAIPIQGALPYASVAQAIDQVLGGS